MENVLKLVDVINYLNKDINFLCIGDYDEPEVASIKDFDSQGVFLNTKYKPVMSRAGVYRRFKEIKPILRPLIDLTKEIEINGTEITPIKELSREGVLFDDQPISDSYSDYKQWSVWEYEKLIEWHFDVFGLIEKRLAIDINTI